MEILFDIKKNAKFLGSRYRIVFDVTAEIRFGIGIQTYEKDRQSWSKSISLHGKQTLFV